MPARYFDPLVLTSKTVFLQRVQACVIDGYRHYVTGSIPVTSAPGLVRKFRSLYAVDCDKNERYRRKLAGFGNARLLLHLNHELQLDFALLVTPGEHLAHAREHLRDARHQPLVHRELELVPLTGKGLDKPRLTWRLTAETVQAWEHRLHLATAHNDELELRRCWHSLYRTPGFGGVRRQVGQLVSYWRREWIRHRGQAPCPMEFPHNDLTFRYRPGIAPGEDGRNWTRVGFPSSAQLPKLFYVRLQVDVGERLSRLIASLSAAQLQSLENTAQRPS